MNSFDAIGIALQNQNCPKKGIFSNDVTQSMKNCIVQGD